VGENIFIDRLSQGGMTKGLINWRSLNKKAQDLLNELGFSAIKSKMAVNNLSVAYQQVVEICKSLSRNARVLILDEPTAVLTFSEIEKLFELLHRLKAKGVCIIYVSHRIDEIYRICDKVTILKDGEYVATHSVNNISKTQLINSMVGRELSDLFPPRTKTGLGEEVLRVENLSSGSMVKEISFTLRKGEVLGFSGLIGAGRTEAMETIFGARPMASGEVYLCGKKVHFKNPSNAVKGGIGMLPGDRKLHGVLLRQSIRVNTTISRIKKVSRIAGLLELKKEAKAVKGLLEDLSVKYGNIEENVSSLSGGNQQKISIAKWLFCDCSCIILDEPTRGVDVGAKIEIYKLINKLVASGVGVIVISSEMLEIIGICDRAIVMRNGYIAGELSNKDITEKKLIELAMKPSENKVDVA
jgi:ribose transport system ATP-binding protein